MTKVYKIFLFQVIKCDVTKEAEIESLAQQIQTQYNKLGRIILSLKANHEEKDSKSYIV